MGRKMLLFIFIGLVRKSLLNNVKVLSVRFMWVMLSRSLPTFIVSRFLKFKQTAFYFFSELHFSIFYLCDDLDLYSLSKLFK